MGYRKDRPESIQQMFSSIASCYDKTNSVLSFRLHRFWNSKLLKEVTDASNPEILLDLCAGTGEIAFSYLRRAKSPKKIYMIDFCEEMLDCARKKSKDPVFYGHHISFIQGDAQNIPLKEESVHCTTIAYGIRNVDNPLKCIHEVFRVLKPGGTFGILELTEPKNRILKYGHKLYLKIFLPIIGRFFASNKQAYEYLSSSIKNFTKPENIETAMQEAGFVQTSRKPLTGGIATIIQGKKPLLKSS
ncbi:MAG TPA: bifunctional demethylmenaquinone methyltransferase/2-methoxy-6-polyprenyl-1,4-benzoquinol methylase UbiE [Parachlamydiaceae bacterium]|nr:bifunctional demethylmenaquinone methyltransferase/2-methoxy-6-polyprenyl-1,4-benzoquinol methylase UbiE [Parachlamydiaceae bacterium]